MDKKLLKPNILIVDDVPANLKVLQAALEPDYEISAATNGPEALEVATSDPPDLILLDITMPDMNGYEVCMRLKADPRTLNIPVIFITARSEEEEETKGFELGAIDYITKPFSPDIVKARINTHLELKRHRDHLEELNTLLLQEIAERKRTEEALRYLLKKQEINISLAKKLLKRIDGPVPRYIELSEDLSLFVDVISIPCYAEGGDHYFVRTSASDKPDDGKEAGEQRGNRKTVVSLKDQSGHEVSCVLRSIITDLIHHTILTRNCSASLGESVSELNDEICCSEIFSPEDFFTSVNAEIDHQTLTLRYVSAGHPPFLLIRENEIADLPKPGEPGANIPASVKSGVEYSMGEIRLREGDKLIFYTDGLTEMPLKNQKKMIKRDDLKQLVSEIISESERRYRSETGLPVSEIMISMLNRISEISEEQVAPAIYKSGPKNTSADDITILCLEIENQNICYEEIWTPNDTDEIAVLIVELCKKIRSEWEQRGYAFPARKIRMVMEEMLLNAWIHGNRRNPDKTVRVRWQFGNDFRFEVIDEGDGFDYNRIPDPTFRDNITKVNGRGIFIIRYFSEYIRWKKGGRHLIVTFRYSGF
ncbi:response regulator [Desulfobacterales bacterium HSG2]|nr:response regulator [Desulfobacterales bacterium HSG2]